MPIPEPIRPLLDFVQADPSPALNAIVVARNQGGTRIERLNLQGDAADSLRTIPVRFMRGLNNSLLMPYEIGYKPDDHELLVMSASENGVGPIVQSLLALANLPLFAADDGVISHLRFYVFHLENAQGYKALFLKKTSPKMELGRRTLHALMFAEDTFTQVEQKVLLFDEGFDCFIWGGSIYIRNVNNFSAIFDLIQQLRTRAGQTVDDIADKIRIKNIDDFRSACTGQIQMIAKLESIRRKPYLAELNMAQVKSVIDTYGLGITVEADDDGQESLVFEPHPERRWLILKLLDDDYLESDMTELKYAANSKTTVV